MTDYCYCSAVRCGVISAKLLSYYYYYYYYYYFITITITITIICITQGRTAANALQLVALTVKQKCLRA